jgi:hypothetical protein
MADSTTLEKLTAKQHNAIGALLTQPNVRSAAEAAGVPERTLFAWLRQPAFAEEYRLARRESTNQAVARLQSASSAAVSVLLKVLANETTKPTVRVSAARCVLELAIKAVELDDLAARLEALERAYEQKL